MTDMSEAPGRTDRRDSRTIAGAPNFDLLAGVSLRVSVEVGSTSMTLAELLSLSDGSVVEGITDAEGRTSLAERDAMHIATISAGSKA